MLSAAGKTRLSVNCEAGLGGGVVKQRIARAQEGKSGGYRYLKIGAIVEVKCDEKTVSK